MAEKMTCPACQAYTSDVLTRYRDDEPCPYCGLPASAAAEVLVARRKNADQELTAKYEAAVIRAGRAEGEAARLRDAMEQIRCILDELNRQP